MIKHTICTLRFAPELRFRGRIWQRLLSAGFLTLCSASSACLSDIDVSDCARQGMCGHAGASGASGSTASASAGAAGEVYSTIAGDGGQPNAGAGGDDTVGGGGTAGGDDTVGGSGTVGGSDALGGGGGAVGGSGGTAGGAGTGGAGCSTGCTTDCKNCVILPVTLRRPCANQPYRTSLTVSNGVAPYRWQVTPADWNVAVAPTATDRATLSADTVASGTSNVTIQVTDAEGASKTANFSLVAREACWFAYTTADAASGPKLKLLDPLAEPPSPAPIAHNEGVYDFQFSPNGQFLAYRFGRDATHPNGRHLGLITLSTLQERVIDVLEDSLVAYRWSPDSQLIALGFTKDGTTYLTAVRIPAPGSSAALIELAPKPAFIESNLYWVGTSFVTFHAQRLPDLAHPGQWLPNPYQLRTPFYARLGGTGFDAPQAIVEQPYDPHVYMQANPNGFFMIGDNTYFNPLSPTVESPVPLWMTNVISPSGKYAAELDDGQVHIFDARQTLDGNAIATSGARKDCPTLLTWARDRERFACVADIADSSSGTRGEVRIFDLDASNHLEMATLEGACTESSAACATQLDRYVYSEGMASHQARALSPSGRWLAFATSSGPTDNYLYWADLAAPHGLKGKAYYFTQAATGNSPTEISFSPDESTILLRRGKQLNRWRSSQPLDHVLVSNDVVVGQECSDDFMSGPDEWCGNTDRSTIFHWSSDSASASFRTASEIRVYELSNNATYNLPALPCGEQCDGQFAFQPLLQP